MGMEEFGNKIGGDGSPDDLVECSVSVRFAIPDRFRSPSRLRVITIGWGYDSCTNYVLRICDRSITSRTQPRTPSDQP